MNIFGKAGIVVLMILAFLVYFLSESMLRQAAVSNINPQSVNMESLVTKLPASVRESVNYKIETKRLRNAIKDATNDSDKVDAIVNLAEYTKAPGQRLWLYSELLKEYPSNPQTYRVYSVFLLNDGDGPRFSMQDYQAFILNFDQITAYNMWVSGMNRLVGFKVSPSEMLKFLDPLMSINPQYREYGRIYLEISKLAAKQDEKNPLIAKADAIVEICRGLPTIDEFLKKRADDLKASKAAETKQPGKGG